MVEVCTRRGRRTHLHTRIVRGTAMPPVPGRQSHDTEIPMSKLPLNPGADVDDQDKAHTPDKLRNDDARWKEKDMPESEHTATPDDYEKPPKP